MAPRLATRYALDGGVGLTGAGGSAGHERIWELSQGPPRHDTPKDLLAVILLGIAIVGGVIELFFRPFGVGPIAFLCALIGMAISEKHPEARALDDARDHRGLRGRRVDLRLVFEPALLNSPIPRGDGRVA